MTFFIQHYEIDSCCSISLFILIAVYYSIVWVYHNLLVTWLMDISLFPFLSIKKNIVHEHSSTCLLEHIYIHFWNIGIGVKLLSHGMFSTFNLFSLPKGLYQFIRVRVLIAPYSLQHYIVSHFSFIYTSGYEVVSHCYIFREIVPFLTFGYFWLFGCFLLWSAYSSLLSVSHWVALFFILRILSVIWIRILCQLYVCHDLKVCVLPKYLCWNPNRWHDGWASGDD